MANVCFVIQHLTKSASDIDSPSGTLTVVHQLIKHWNKKDQIFVLCNTNYANYLLLNNLQQKYGFQLDELAYMSVQDRTSAKMLHTKQERIPWLTKVAIKAASPFITVRTLWEIRNYLAHNKIDAIYSHSGGYPGSNLNILATIAGQLMNINHNFLIIHNMPVPVYLKRLPFSYIQDRLVGFCASRILSVSESCADDLSKNRFLKKKVEWIYNGLNISTGIERSTAEKPKWASEIPVIAFLGSIHPRKGIHILIEALPEIKEPWKLVILGSGNDDYIKNLKDLISNYQLEEHVIFAGFHPKAASLLKFTDLLVLPSISYESFGMVILEAMRLKKPVVCSDFGGMKEVVSHDKSGLVVPANNHQELAKAISYLLKHPSIARQMGEHGYLRLKSKFDIQKITLQYESLMD